MRNCARRSATSARHPLAGTFETLRPGAYFWCQKRLGVQCVGQLYA